MAGGGASGPSQGPSGMSAGAHELLAVGTNKLVVACSTSAPSSSTASSSFLNFSPKIEWEEDGGDTFTYVRGGSQLTACWLHADQSDLFVSAAGDRLSLLNSASETVVTQDSFPECGGFRALASCGSGRDPACVSSSARGLQLWSVGNGVELEKVAGFASPPFEFEHVAASLHEQRMRCCIAASSGARIWMQPLETATGDSFSGKFLAYNPSADFSPSQVVESLVFAQRKDLLAATWTGGKTVVFDASGPGEGRPVYEKAGAGRLGDQHEQDGSALTSLKTYVSFSPHHGDLLISARSDGLLQFTDIKSGGARQEIKSLQTKQGITSLSYCGDGVRLALGTQNKGVLLFDLRKASDPVFPKILLDQPVRHVSWSSASSAKRRSSGSATSLASKVEAFASRPVAGSSAVPFREKIGDHEDRTASAGDGGTSFLQSRVAAAVSSGMRREIIADADPQPRRNGIGEDLNRPTRKASWNAASDRQDRGSNAPFSRGRGEAPSSRDERDAPTGRGPSPSTAAGVRSQTPTGARPKLEPPIRASASSMNVAGNMSPPTFDTKVNQQHLLRGKEQLQSELRSQQLLLQEVEAKEEGRSQEVEVLRPQEDKKAAHPSELQELENRLKSYVDERFETLLGEIRRLARAQEKTAKSQEIQRLSVDVARQFHDLEQTLFSNLLQK
ncbi:unnamed protein product [Amoebophrya sp. A25]|nr:unnamed protein product [Amoebophrya sp. A25]|eukprot:GSA25T00017780001.1